MDTSCNTIGYLGPEGSHSHRAAWVFSQQLVSVESTVLQGFSTLLEVMEAVEGGLVAGAILPVENALEGSVTEVTETLGLQKKTLQPVCEFLLPIRHALIQADPTQPVSVIYSHPQALAQCRESLTQRFGNTILLKPVSSTAEAVRSLRQNPTDGAAAIGSAVAAELYGCSVVIEDVSDAPGNATRFWFIAQKPQALESPPSLPILGHKTSLCFGVGNHPGSLVDILSLFKTANINLTKIESRPSKKQFGEYYFFLDAQENLQIPKFQRLWQNFRSQTSFLNILGPYPCLGCLDT